MDSEKIKEVFVRSASDLLRYNKETQGHSDAVVGIESYSFVGTNNLLLCLEDGIDDTAGAYLNIGNGDLVLGKESVTYPFYDHNSKTLNVEITNPLIVNMINDQHPDMCLEFDLSFLIQNAREYYSSFGDRIGYPEISPEFSDSEIVFPAKFTPSNQQKVAVKTILNSKLSYIWGAPGTGKTQMVLATAIMAYLRRGKRIAIIAPTNNSVEQVLRGVINVINSDEGFKKIVNLERDIVRVGTATQQFIEDYPELCEAQSIGGLISKKKKEVEVLKGVFYEKYLDRISANIRALELLFQERKKPADRKTKRMMTKQFDDLLKELRKVIDMDEHNQDLVRDLNMFNFEYQIEVIKKRLYQRPRPMNSIP